MRHCGVSMIIRSAPLADIPTVNQHLWATYPFEVGPEIGIFHGDLGTTVGTLTLACETDAVRIIGRSVQIDGRGVFQSRPRPTCSVSPGASSM